MRSTVHEHCDELCRAGRPGISREARKHGGGHHGAIASHHSTNFRALSLFRILIPETPRCFRAQRWVRISLRTLHLVGVAGLGGGFLYSVDQTVWMPYLTLTFLTGVAMVGIELWSTGLWLIQLRGLSVVIKLALIVWLLQTEHFQLPLFMAVIVISGVISHAPGTVRYFSVFHWRRLDGL